jgi:hypothetical protein
VVTGAVEGDAAENGVSVTLDALANTSDVDDGTILAVTDLPEVLPPGVTFDPETHSFTLDPSNAAYQHLAAGEQTTVTVNYQVTDGTATTDASVSWTVTGTNEAPVIQPATTATGGITAVPLEQIQTPQTALAASYLLAGNVLINGLGGDAGFGENTLERGDDNSSGAIDITSVFGQQGLNFFGKDYTSIYINNNGNITFKEASRDFTPDQINAGADNPIIAPFWADVDTRGGAGTLTLGGNSTGSNRVYYDLDSVNGVLTITWDDVGYFNAHTDKLNAFQLQLISLGNGDFDVVFRYEDINWTTGDASGGVNGLGGLPARAGYSAGDGVHFFELPGSGRSGSSPRTPEHTRRHRHCWARCIRGSQRCRSAVRAHDQRAHHLQRPR